MVATIIGLILHLAQTIGYFWCLANANTATVWFWYLANILGFSNPVIVGLLDLVGFILPSYLLLIVYSFRFVLLNLNNSS